MMLEENRAVQGSNMGVFRVSKEHLTVDHFVSTTRN